MKRHSQLLNNHEDTVGAQGNLVFPLMRYLTTQNLEKKKWMEADWCDYRPQR